MALAWVFMPGWAMAFMPSTAMPRSPCRLTRYYVRPDSDIGRYAGVVVSISPALKQHGDEMLAMAAHYARALR